MGQGLAFGRFELAAVLGQRRGGDGAVLAEAGEFGAEAAGPDGLGLVGVAQAPQHGAGGGGDGGEDDLGVGGGDLGHLVEDHHRPRPEGGAVEGEAGDGHGLDPGLAEFAGGLVGGGQADDGMAGLGGGDGGGMDGGGLPEPGRGDQAPDGRARLAQGPDGVGLVGAEAGFLGGDGLLDEGGVEAVDGEDGEVAEVVEDPLLQTQVVEGGVLRRAAAGAVDEEDGVVGVEERLGEVLDGLDVEAAGAEGGDLLDDVGVTEAGPVGAQPVLRVDEGLDDVVPFQPGPELGNGPVADLPPRGRGRWGIPITSASACHRSRSTSGVREPSLRGRVASDAASSALIRMTSGRGSPGRRRPGARRWPRPFRERPQPSGSNPAISRHPWRSGPHSTPSCSVRRRRSSSW